jgi:hypothetical protein
VSAVERLLLADSPSLAELIERHRGARGLATLRMILSDARIGLDVCESELELDSRAHHADGDSFERDRARDTALLAIGLRTTRVTARRLRLDGDRLERELRAALGLGG